MSKPSKRVVLDYPKLTGYLERKKIAKKDLSRMVGRSETYVTILGKKTDVLEVEEALICRVLGEEPGYFIKMPEDKQAGSEQLGELLREIKKTQEELQTLKKQETKILESFEEFAETLEKVFRKVNANTVQLERLRENVKPLILTDYEKTVAFIKELLSGGQMDGEEVLRKCDAAGLKRADVNKAKHDLGITTASTGYGKNQKTWWILR